MVLEVLRQQISQWYDGLPPNIKFPEDTTSLLDPQKAFLRTQYFALRWVITWPAVVRILTKEPDDENQHAELLRFSSEALHYLIAHVLSAESLLQERHQMLFANLLGTYYSTMILLTIYHAPILDFVRTPATRAAICKGHAMLSIWAANPGVASNIRRIEEQMIRCGLLQTKGPAAISPASTTTPTTITTTTTTTTKSTASTTTSVPPEAVHQQSTVSGYQHQNNRLGPGASAEQVPLARTRMGLEDVMEPVLGPNPIKPAQNDVHTNQNAKVEYSAAQY
ncbi:hypothetical protein K432DRAFT_430370 [Lepidopterella palustris CBS 459.81]|uniref:Transcription factor domain-containing protein n=1 Tax=Lepidopterella palustris CBS 459.81 TaxID=1314670 RepID=A0A8E2DXZ4_9PEZI|nr:hypothetical protein K432DRAFT_430370 [Lepidopterella palustris CBS 459.81]